MRKVFSKMDKPLLFIMIILCAIGLLMVFSSSSITAILRYNKPSTYFFTRQLIFFIMAFIIGIILLYIPSKWYKPFSIVAIIGIIAILILLLTYGKITSNVQSWFYIGPFAIQPSEFAKSFLIIFMACFYDTLVKRKIKNMWVYLIPIVITLLIVALIMMQPDFGSAMILLAIGFCTFISVPMPKSNLPKILMALAIAAIIFGIGILYSNTDILKNYQLQRLNFHNPCSRYQEDTGYQVCNGFIAINNGGLWGVGIGNSTQKYLYLPESHTDFIFAILVEELGVVFAIFVLFLYFILLYRLLVIAKDARDLKGSIIAYGTFWFFTFHIIVNLTGMLAILPLTGVPFPLMSYGGSSTLNFVIMLFMCEKVAIDSKNKTYKLDTK